ncbi:MAG: hypothetical protein NTZ92_05010 [Candidatus Omnitrophica bacterium]|nr:hypothetical protein [Candidatus Omnitrophota bacterium]
MAKIIFSNKLWLIIVLSLALVIPFNNAFARGGYDRQGGHGSYGGQGNHGGYDRQGGGSRYNSGWFWGSLAAGLVIGSIVSTLSSHHETVYANAEPVGATDAAYISSVNQSQVYDRETVTINVPSRNGGSIAITLVGYDNGFVGPQGEFYSTLPTAEQLRIRYGE